jgi:hypothetical protein
VQVYDKDLRTEQLLGEAITKPDGSYEVTYTADQFRRAEKRTADLTFRVSSQEEMALRVTEVIVGERPLPDPKILFNAPPEVWANLIVLPPARLSEYEKLLSTLMPVLEDVQLADLSADDIAFLVGETGIERSFLEWLRGAAALGRETGLPTEAFYAFARRVPPLASDWIRLPQTPPLSPEERAKVMKAILDGLTKASRDELRSALLDAIAIEKNIIPSSFEERVDDIVRALKRYGLPLRQTPAVLRDKDTSEPLVNFTVRIFDLDTGVPPEDVPPEELGVELTNAEGSFTLVYPAELDAGTDTRRHLHVKVFEGGTKEIAQQDLDVKSGQTETVEIKIAVPKPPEPASYGLDELAKTVGLDIPPALKEFLDKREIRSLADIRRAGGLGRLDGLPVAPDHAAVKVLEAHADLSRLSPNVNFNASLIEKGYISVAAIARTPRPVFVSKVHEQIGDFKAAQIQVMARARIQFLNNILAGIEAERANGYDLRLSPEAANLIAGEDK